MINQSSSLKELSTWDLRTLRVVRTSSSYWKWCVTAYLTSWFLHWAFKYLIFHTRHCKSRGQIYLWDLITEPQKVSNGCQRANISFSCFPWNEHNLIVRFAVNAETVETALIYGSQPWSLFFPLMTEISCATNWRALPPCTCRFPLWSCSPAHTAVYNLLRNLSNLRAAEMARKNKKKMAWTWAQRAGMAQLTWLRRPPVATADGESALGAALRAAGQEKRREMHREYGLWLDSACLDATGWQKRHSHAWEDV